MQVMIFVFIGTMSVKNTDGNIVGIAIAHGLTIALLIAGFGGIRFVLVFLVFFARVCAS